MNIDNNKFKAFKKTLGFCAITFIAVLVFTFILSFIPLQIILWAFLIGLFVFGFYIMYSFNLNALEVEENSKDKK
jgi:O-antigen/teichoic acid export membrane protein